MTPPFTMISKNLILANFILVVLSACISTRSMPPEAARQTIKQAWDADRHIIWEIDWPAAPLAGAVTVEIWRLGPRYRYEILESAAPALVGQTLVFDGQHAWRYNRLEPLSTLEPVPAVLSPVTDAFGLADNFLARSPVRATREEFVQLKHGPAQKIELRMENDDRLTVWLDQATGLPARLTISVEGEPVTLQARTLEPLIDPPPALFEPDTFRIE
jgi:hypothetical protein